MWHTKGAFKCHEDVTNKCRIGQRLIKRKCTRTPAIANAGEVNFGAKSLLIMLFNSLDSGHLTLLHSRLSVHQLTTNFSPKLLHTLTIYYIHFWHHCQPPLNPTDLDGAHTHINFLDIQPIFRTATSSPECCTKTPIGHYLSFYCAVCACTCQVNVFSWQFGVAYCALLCAVCITGCSFYILFIGCVLSCQFYNKIELNWIELKSILLVLGLEDPRGHFDSPWPWFCAERSSTFKRSFISQTGVLML